VSFQRAQRPQCGVRPSSMLCRTAVHVLPVVPERTRLAGSFTALLSAHSISEGPSVRVCKGTDDDVGCQSVTAEFRAVQVHHVVIPCVLARPFFAVLAIHPLGACSYQKFSRM
jgi:hypothetical protein